jgi:hypothetical protein
MKNRYTLGVYRRKVAVICATAEYTKMKKQKKIPDLTTPVREGIISIRIGRCRPNGRLLLGYKK